MVRRIGIFIAFAAIGVLFRVHPADAAVCGSTTNAIRVITRDSSGTLVPGMNVQVYHKNTDPDGNPYLATSPLATGVTDAGG